MATGGELEFEAPLARFDVDEWTEFHNSPSDGDSYVVTDIYQDSIALRPATHHVCEPKRIRIPSDRGSSGSSNLAETFNETFSGSLEDLVNTFDQRVTKCCRNYDEQVEHLAPVQIRPDDDTTASNCQNWYTLTGTFGNLPPINWSNFCTKTHRKNLDGSEDDVEDDEELFCTIDELEDAGSDLFDNRRIKQAEDGAGRDDNDDDDDDSLDNADDVINELESLLEDQDETFELTTTPHSLPAATLPHTLPSTILVHMPPSPDKDGVWFEESVKKLTTHALSQLSADLSHAIVDYKTALHHELTVNEQLKVENQLQRDFIALTLSIERRQRQLVTQCDVSEDDDDDVYDEQETMRAAGEAMYLSTVIPYRPNDKLTVHHLQIYINLLSAIDEDSPTVPHLLTDYILKVLCPAA